MFYNLYNKLVTGRGWDGSKVKCDKIKNCNRNYIRYKQYCLHWLRKPEELTAKTHQNFKLTHKVD